MPSSDLNAAAWERSMRLVAGASRPETGILVGEHPLLVLVAFTPEQRAAGLAGLDMAGYDGMLFGNETDTTAAFHMSGMTEPLDIAWFDADGVCVGTATMTPDQVFHPPVAYRYALEMTAGKLKKMGVKPGVKLRRRKTW